MKHVITRNVKTPALELVEFLQGVKLSHIIRFVVAHQDLSGIRLLDVRQYVSTKLKPNYSYSKIKIKHLFTALEPVSPRDACQPSPCGANAVCRVSGDSPSCSCLDGFIGAPPNCRPECVSNSDCSSQLACINQKCRDPCPGSCGTNAECRVVSHTPNCVCTPGYTGNPFILCNIEPPQAIPLEKVSPCLPSPCGPNALCREQNGAGACTCLQDYVGNPYEGCRPECILNSDCQSNRACIRQKCQDPCPGTCGQNAVCQVVNHLASCTCIPGYTGDPFRYCNIEPVQCKKQNVLFLVAKFKTAFVIVPPEVRNPCAPNPCGPNSLCREVNNQAVCSCLPEFIGSPPGCRPECTVSSECLLNQACVNQKCKDPCPNTCGLNAACQVINHSPVCSCTSGYTGDPFTRCFPQARKYNT